MEVNGQIYAPALLPLGKEPPPTRWVGGWVGPRAGLEAVAERKYPFFWQEWSPGRPVRSTITILSNLS
jgi:hypothetical protein